MIAVPDTKQGQDSLRLAIEAAFFQTGSAAHIASAFSTGGKKLHASDVQRIWDAAKERGDLPKLNRPNGGPGARKTA